jgi:multidrug efflux pump subunit AcrA (membrane-fusion protein)
MLAGTNHLSPVVYVGMIVEDVALILQLSEVPEAERTATVKWLLQLCDQQQAQLRQQSKQLELQSKQLALQSEKLTSQAEQLALQVEQIQLLKDKIAIRSFFAGFQNLHLTRLTNWPKNDQIIL